MGDNSPLDPDPGSEDIADPTDQGSKAYIKGDSINTRTLPDEQHNVVVSRIKEKENKMNPYRDYTQEYHYRPKYRHTQYSFKGV